MGWLSRRGIGSTIHGLTIALSVLGTAVSALPFPLLAEAASFCQPVSDAPFSPSREDDRDETSDDASDLVWLEVELFARGRASGSVVRSPGRLRDSMRVSGPGAGLDGLPAGRDPRSRGSGVPLTIRLCRLTC